MSDDDLICETVNHVADVMFSIAFFHGVCEHTT